MECMTESKTDVLFVELLMRVNSMREKFKANPAIKFTHSIYLGRDLELLEFADLDEEASAQYHGKPTWSIVEFSEQHPDGYSPLEAAITDATLHERLANALAERTRFYVERAAAGFGMDALPANADSELIAAARAAVAEVAVSE